MLAQDANTDAPSLLADSLWYKYRTAPDWAWTVWDNTVACLRQIPSITPDIDDRRAYALKYANFLTAVNKHLPAKFDQSIAQWFSGSGKNEIAVLSAEVWDVMTVVLLHLSVYGALSTATILQGLAFPIWHSAAACPSPDSGASLDILLAAVNDLCRHLLVSNTCGSGFPPYDFFEAQGLRTRRRDMYRDPNFALLVENIPSLVQIEHNPNLSDYNRKASKVLRKSICGTTVFRQGAYRELDTVNRAFSKALQSSHSHDDIQEPLLRALRFMLDGGDYGKTLNTSGLGEQRLTFTQTKETIMLIGSGPLPP